MTRRYVWLLIGVLVVAVGYAVSSKTIKVVVSARTNNCAGNLTIIEMALQQYSSEHGCPPPAAVVDENGNRLHSWRVLLLPYLGESEMFAQYRLNEPWNSKHNLFVTHEMPSVFSCHLFSSGAPFTNYLAVTDGIDGLRCQVATLDGIVDAGGVVVVAGCERSNVRWNEPYDLERDAKGMFTKAPGGKSVSLGDNGVLLLTPSDGVKWTGRDELREKVSDSRDVKKSQAEQLFGRFFKPLKPAP